MEIISRREHHEETVYEHRFGSAETHPNGMPKGVFYGFPCDKDGKLIAKGMNPVARENYEKCMRGEIPGIIDHGVISWVRRWTEAAVGRCSCGRKVYLDGFTNTCDCGKDYNSAGQELAPREQWGEETGESVSDILRIG